MKKLAEDLKKGDTIEIGAEKLIIEEIEISDLGKHGSKKVRIVAKKQDGEKAVIIRPDKYPFNCS